MPSASKDETPITAAGPAYESRMLEWGDLTVSFESIQAGDHEALFEGLPDNRCQCPHYGVLLKGRMLIRYSDHTETITAGQAYYMPPGHTPLVEEDCETILFSPTADLRESLAVIEKNARTSGGNAA